MSKLILDATTRWILDRNTNCSDIATLGNVVERTDIKSVLRPFRIMPDYTIFYPDVVIKALCNLYDEYNHAFASLVVANREWETDYQYCMTDNAVPINWCVQIDMVGLPEALFRQVDGMSERAVREIVRKGIFEIENSIAMYQFLEGLFSRNGNDSVFNARFRKVLDDLRRRFGRPIALLSVTKPKYDAMLASEFGKHPGDQLTDAEIKELSGFDTFFGPEQFRGYLMANDGRCEYLLYIRSSDPVDKLKKPEVVVDHPLLGDIEMRRVIKAHALTFNVDAPDMEYTKRINDTKEYMVLMGMALPITSEGDLISLQFENYLHSQGISYESMVGGKERLRCKPMKGTYGCYGHVSGALTDKKFRSELRRNLRLRGRYVVQPEMATPIITNVTDGVAYTFIDRNFFGMIDGHPEFLGGVRNLIPVETIEAREGRIHGNASAVYAEIRAM